MTADIPELWSAQDRASEARLLAAVARDDLLEALLAVDGATPEAEAEARAFLDAAAARVGAALDRLPVDASGDAGRAVRALIEVLVDEERLVGAAADYYAPDNSRLTRVLARRAGQPILLASVWLLVARGAGLEAHGLGLPGHFVARVAGIVVDPFAGGAPLTDAQCRDLVARALPGRPFDLSWLAPTNVRSIATRVLRNLGHALRQAGDRGRAASAGELAAAIYRATRLLASLVPDDGPAQIELARLTEEAGAWPEALALYRRIADRFAGRREAQIAEVRKIELESRSRILN